MTSIHFLLLSIFCAVMRLGISWSVLTIGAFLFASLGMYASIIEFKRYGWDKKPFSHSSQK